MISPVGTSWIFNSIMMCLFDFLWVSFLSSSHCCEGFNPHWCFFSVGYRRKRDDIHKRRVIYRERWSKSGWCRIYPPPNRVNAGRYRCVRGVQDSSHSQMCTIMIRSLTLSCCERWESAVRASSRLQHPVLDIPRVNTGGAYSISPAHTSSRNLMMTS